MILCTDFLFFLRVFVIGNFSLQIYFRVKMKQIQRATTGFFLFKKTCDYNLMVWFSIFYPTFYLSRFDRNHYSLMSFMNSSVKEADGGGSCVLSAAFIG